MPPKHSSSRTQQPAQRRPRTERACNSCRQTKHRCEPIKYGTNDRPCRRCTSLDLDCNLPRVARSQSPSPGVSAQGLGPSRNIIGVHSAAGATDEVALGTEANLLNTLQQPESLQDQLRVWSPFVMHAEMQQGSSTPTILPPRPTSFQTTSFLPVPEGIEGYHQHFPNIAQGAGSTGSTYYSQDCYGGTPGHTYMVNYATQGASDGVTNSGYALEDTQLDDSGSVQDQDVSDDS